ncbi:ion channel [Xanthobacteraceae bacterium A53D]
MRGVIPGELLYGILVSLVTVGVHSMASVFLVKFMLALGRRVKIRHPVRELSLGMMLTGAILTFAHIIEVGVWAGAYVLVGAVAIDHDAYYLAFVNFTTLGYGDLLPTPQWRVLGPVTAANGMLLFGWSTALIFAVLTRLATFLGVNRVRPGDSTGNHGPKDDD